MTHPAATLPVFLPAIAAAAMRNADRRIHHDLLDAQATSEHAAIPLEYRGLRRRRLERLVEAGVISIGEGNGYYLHPDRWEQYRASRRERGVIAIAIVLAMAAIVYLAANLGH